MRLGKNWQWLKFVGEDKPIPDRFGDCANLAIECMNLMLSKSRADFALWWGPADQGMWGADFNHLNSYDPEFYTLADFRTQHRITETTLGSVTGAELKGIRTRWGRNRELLLSPAQVMSRSCRVGQACADPPEAFLDFTSQWPDISGQGVGGSASLSLLDPPPE